MMLHSNSGSIDVKTIYATDSAFAALLVDGSVVTWGNSEYGANKQSVSEELDGRVRISQIFSNKTFLCSVKRRWFCYSMGLCSLWR